MDNFYNNFQLQREDVLARIAQKLELDPTRRKKMEQTYKAVSDWLDKDEGFFKNLKIDIYAQGSVRIYTTVKPINGEDFDLDIVLHINHVYTDYTPQQIYFELIRRLKENDNYKRIIEEKNRCARLDYAGDFHMDILPGCLVTILDNHKLNVPDKKLRNWSSTNPKDYSIWFLDRANSSVSPLLEGYYTKLFSEQTTLKAETEELPSQDYYTKKPLQRGVQLIKRRRDIYFKDKPELKTSSIILTTLAGILYSGENTIYETINNILDKVIVDLSGSKRLKILNPVNSEEDFTEKWDEEPKLYEEFKNFIRDFYRLWQELKSDFSNSSKAYDVLFGESIYKETIISQTRFFGQFSNDNLIKSSATLLGDNFKTDTSGNINKERGLKNESHRDYGDI